MEDALYAHPAVSEAAVIGVPHERWIEAVSAVVVLKEDVEPEELIAFARARLAATRCPNRCTSSTSCPRTPRASYSTRDLRRAFGGTESAVATSPTQTTT